MRKSFYMLIAATLVASIAAHAQQTGHVRYRWHDAKGLPHYSDSLTAEAMKFGYDLVNDRGLTVGHVDRQLTAEERAAAQQAAAEQAAIKHEADKRAHDDEQLLSAYPDELALTTMQKQETDTVEQQIHTTEINLQSQQQALTDLLGRAGELERARKPVPKYLTDSIAKQRDVVNQQRARLQRQHAKLDETRQHAAALLQHYRELKATRD